MAPFIYLNQNRLKISPAAKIIKAGDLDNLLAADEVLSIARQKADQILSAARVRAEEIKAEGERAYTLSKENGYQEGLESAEREMAIRMHSTAIKTDQYYQKIEADLTDLVMETVRKVIGEIDADELILRLAQKALVMMRSQNRVVLKTAPEQMDHLNNHLGELTASHPNIDAIEVRGDTRLSAQDLLLESPLGIVDAGVETQLTAIKEAFEACFKK